MTEKEQIKAEIEGRIALAEKCAEAACEKNLHSALEANEMLIRQYKSLLAFIDSLPEKGFATVNWADDEWGDDGLRVHDSTKSVYVSYKDVKDLRQRLEGVDVTDFCKPIDPGIAQCIADHWWEMLGDKEPDKNPEEAAVTYSKQVSDGHNYRDLRDGFIAGDKWAAEQFAKIVRANLPEIGKDAQFQFEQLYFEITGNKMYGGYND